MSPGGTQQNISQGVNAWYLSRQIHGSTINSQLFVQGLLPPEQNCHFHTLLHMLGIARKWFLIMPWLYSIFVLLWLHGCVLSAPSLILFQRFKFPQSCNLNNPFIIASILIVHLIGKMLYGKSHFQKQDIMQHCCTFTLTLIKQSMFYAFNLHLLLDVLVKFYFLSCREQFLHWIFY